MSSTAPAVRLEHVHKRFATGIPTGTPTGTSPDRAAGPAERIAVRDLDFSISSGSICGFLGPNGAGKTTTLRMILGLIRPDRGRVEVLGANDPAGLRDRLAYLPEERGVYRRMGVLEFLLFLGRLHGLSSREAKARATRWLDRLDLSASAGARCDALSKGMSQKLQLAGALLHEPELVILDEPFSGLDPVNVELAREIVVELRRAGRTVILSTHVMEQAELLCDEVLLLDRGERVLAGPLRDVLGAGAGTLRIAYEGDGAALHGLAGVTRVNDAGVSAELSLAPDADPDALLAALQSRLRLRRFEFAEPSLHEVFVRAVGGAREAPAP